MIFFQLSRYRILNPSIPKDNPIAGCKQLLQQLPIDQELWRSGVTKIFLKDKLVPIMTELRDEKLKHYAGVIERYYLTWKKCVQFKQMRAASVRLQSSDHSSQSQY